ncbi:MAG: hypothetical protein LCH95_01270 [Proteobacteria bacterium]|nr:hypothetical protein [Pseudomonadota bacterium]
MNAKFDVSTEREDMMAVQLPIISRFDPGRLAPVALPGQLLFNIESLAKCYWLGLAMDAVPRLLDIIGWMETRVPPDMGYWPRGRFHPLEGAIAHRDWWLSLGLGKWLVGMPNPEADLARAVESVWSGWQQLSLTEADDLSRERDARLGEYVATALAAKSPERGILFCGSPGGRKLASRVRPIVEFGEWACAHLVGGGARDADFVSRGAHMLRLTLLPYFRAGAKWIEPTLWLKTIYFDSGVTKTPEETVFRAYDSLPGIPRPTFVSR